MSYNNNVQCELQILCFNFQLSLSMRVCLCVCVSVPGERTSQDVQTLGLHGHDGAGKANGGQL